MNFCHLHNHTHYSLLDGANKIPALVSRAKELGQAALAITDHGNMFGVPEFCRECRRQGIKPIVGMEAYIAPGSRFDKAKTHSENYYHLLLLAVNETGYRNLMFLSSCGYLEGFYYKPRIDKELLARRGEGLIVASACLAGEIPTLLARGDRPGAIKSAEWFAENFPGRFYLEIQNHGIPGEWETYRQIAEIARELRLPLVASNDVHYLNRGDHLAHDVLLCIQTGKSLDDPGRLRYNTTELYLKSADEMLALFPAHEEALHNTAAIAAAVQETGLPVGAPPLKKGGPGGLSLPAFPLPPGVSPDAHLRQQVFAGLKTRYNRQSPTPGDAIFDRINRELAVIEAMCFAGYFLIVADFVNYAKSQNIPVGPGRGSVAGSLVAYCLGITEVDPLRYNLLFERFLNPDRVNMPDIDIDFCFERREEVIEYVRHKYGPDRVQQIITFGTLGSRQAVTDVGRALGKDFQSTKKLSERISPALCVREAFDAPELRQYQAGEWQSVIAYAAQLEGLNRHASVHAAGVVIAPGPVTDYAPLYLSHEGSGPARRRVVTTQYDMNQLEAIGLLKMDFLGLRTLTVISNCQSSIENLQSPIFNLQCPQTFALFASAQTVGVFQFESRGMRDYLRKLKPNCIEDLIALNAMYRPGPMQFIDEYIDRKNGKKFTYPHPSLEPVLKETYGVIVYQEQVIRIAAECAGFTLSEADLLRRAMGKKKPEEMAEYQERFIAGCAARSGIAAPVARQIWAMVAKFAEYGFNKSHAVAYALLAYQTAWLKAHYPAHFMAASLTSEIGDPKRVAVLINECARMGIPVLPPDVNVSNFDFNCQSSIVNRQSSIIFALSAVKHLGASGIERIIAARAAGPFKSFADFCARLRQGGKPLTPQALESLIVAGAFDNLHGIDSRASLLASPLLGVAGGGSPTLFDSHQSPAANPQPSIFSPAERLRREKELLGFYLSGNPLSQYRETLESWCTLDWEAELRKGMPVKSAGIITEIKIHRDRRGKEMAFLGAEDPSGEYEMIVFADLYAECRETLATARPVAFAGKIDTFSPGRIKIICEEILPLEELQARAARSLTLTIDAAQVSEAEIAALHAVIAAHPGPSALYFTMLNSRAGASVNLKSKNSVNINPKLLAGIRRFLPPEHVAIRQLPIGN